MAQFNELSIKLTREINKQTKKAQGIYFTPKTISTSLTNKALSELGIYDNIKVLEPSCGTCEFVSLVDELITNSYIHCIELNTDIFEAITDIEFKNTIGFENEDFTKYEEDDGAFDLVIGNPPYFVCKKENIPNKYKQYITGRPNMFGIFILHSLSKLKIGGILAFVVPKSFLNSAYYADIRNFIKHTCTIVSIDDYENNNDFLDTEQSTFGLILRKEFEDESGNVELDGCDYSVMINGSFIFTPDSSELNKYFEGATTLEKMGLAVKTGTVVWNEKKDLLTSNEKETILLYNTNVTNENKIKLTTFKNDEKGQYIRMEGSCVPLIVVNRGNGNASYNFKYALVDINEPYLVENHLNMIYSKYDMSKAGLMEKYSQVINSFEKEKTREFIKLFFGNNGLSKTELETVLPIYL